MQPILGAAAKTAGVVLAACDLEQGELRTVWQSQGSGFTLLELSPRQPKPCQ